MRWSFFFGPCARALHLVSTYRDPFEIRFQHLRRREIVLQSKLQPQLFSGLFFNFLNHKYEVQETSFRCEESIERRQVSVNHLLYSWYWNLLLLWLILLLFCLKRTTVQCLATGFLSLCWKFTCISIQSSKKMLQSRNY